MAQAPTPYPIIDGESVLDTDLAFRDFDNGKRDLTDEELWNGETPCISSTARTTRIANGTMMRSGTRRN